MRILAAFLLAVFLFSNGLFAQRRANVATQPTLQGTFGNVVFPGGTSAIPGVKRNFGNVVFPGTGGPKVNIPFSITDPTFADRLGRTVAGQNFVRPQVNAHRGRFNNNRAVVIPYAYPVYVGGAYGGYVDGAAPEGQGQPNITVIYPPQPAPVMMMPQDQSAAPPPDTVSIYQQPVRPSAEEGVSSQAEPTHYLIAFKDHTIYSAVAYWVEGDTLHYFTNGNTHNQVSLSLIDQQLTERLNKESGAEVRLP